MLPASLIPDADVFHLCLPLRWTWWKPRTDCWISRPIWPAGWSTDADCASGRWSNLRGQKKSRREIWSLVLKTTKSRVHLWAKRSWRSWGPSRAGPASRTCSCCRRWTERTWRRWRSAHPNGDLKQSLSQKDVKPVTKRLPWKWILKDNKWICLVFCHQTCSAIWGLKPKEMCAP